MIGWWAPISSKACREWVSLQHGLLRRRGRKVNHVHAWTRYPPGDPTIDVVLDNGVRLTYAWRSRGCPAERDAHWCTIGAHP